MHAKTSQTNIQRRSSIASRPRRGNTANILLGVLVLIVIGAVLLVPVFMKAYDLRQLRKTGNLLETEFTEIQRMATREETIYRFMFQSGTPYFLIEPWHPGANKPAGEAGNENAKKQIVRKLPEGILFMVAELPTREKEIENRLNASQKDAAKKKPGWSLPMLFYPDGKSMSIELLLNDTDQNSVVIERDGKTGITVVNDPHTLADEHRRARSDLR